MGTAPDRLSPYLRVCSISARCRLGSHPERSWHLTGWIRGLYRGRTDDGLGHLVWAGGGDHLAQTRRPGRSSGSLLPDSLSVAGSRPVDSVSGLSGDRVARGTFHLRPTVSGRPFSASLGTLAARPLRCLGNSGSVVAVVWFLAPCVSGPHCRNRRAGIPIPVPLHVGSATANQMG